VFTIVLNKIQTNTVLVGLQDASAANPKLFSLIHNSTSNFTTATMHPDGLTEFVIDCVGFLPDLQAMPKVL